MAVVLVLHFYAPAFTGGKDGHEIRADWEQVGSISDFHVVPRYFLVPFGKLELGGEFAGLFIHLDDGA